MFSCLFLSLKDKEHGILGHLNQCLMASKVSVCVHWTDGWLDGWMHGWKEGSMGGWIGIWTEEQIIGWLDEWVDGSIDR